MIEIDHLVKDFGSFRAVDDLSFSVEKGQVLGFLGPNGAGKSTTMKMITGYLAPTSGTARLLDMDVLKNPVGVKRVLGYLPEGAPAWPDMTVHGFLKFIAEARNIHKAEIASAMNAVVEKTNLETVLDQSIQTLSKGFKRRVGLAQALIHNPQVLIMDEPTDGLDPNQKKDIRDLITSMAEEKAIIISTHILEEVEVICNRAMIIDGGKIVADDTPAGLEARSHLHNSVRLSFSAADMEKAEKILSGAAFSASVEKVAENSILVLSPGQKAILDQTQACLTQASLKPLEIQVERGRLDDVFRSLTGSDVQKAKAANSTATNSGKGA
ncbi:MAG: ABC transporter ATP-binding protein [Alphaproteobacteria bacterium]|nr:ABC transporter ATP-binding protein [Alphaproteobacteria bacterium]